MRNRTIARELALKMLYQLDLRKDVSPEEIDEFCRQNMSKHDVYEFALSLINGCRSNIEEIDEKISTVAEHWDLHRMAIIDKNIIRLGVYELLYRNDIPPKVSINEAIELGKKYSTKESGMFVNGVLDKVYNQFKNGKAKIRTQNLSNIDYGTSDLHIHTNFSDGTVTPEMVVDEAIRLGVSTISITDHDTVEGYLAASRYKNAKKLHIIPGIELSSYLEPSEIHILGYFIDIDDDSLKKIINKSRKDRISRIYTIVEKLQGLQVEIDPQEVFDLAGRGTPGRMHVAEIIWKHGYSETILDSFYKYIGDNCPAYVPKKTLTTHEALKLISDAGGVPVLAHPGITQRDNIIDSLVQYGLKGIEIYYPAHTQQTIQKYLKIAKKHNLAVTGGSDFHGERKNDTPIAKTAIPGDLVSALEQKCNTRK